MAVNFPVADGGSFVVFASDSQGIEFLPGRTLTLTASLSDGTTATAPTTRASGPSPVPTAGPISAPSSTPTAAPSTQIVTATPSVNAPSFTRGQWTQWHASSGILTNSQAHWVSTGVETDVFGNTIPAGQSILFYVNLNQSGAGNSE